MVSGEPHDTAIPRGCLCQGTAFAAPAGLLRDTDLGDLPTSDTDDCRARATGRLNVVPNTLSEPCVL